MGGIFCTKVDKEKLALIQGAKTPKDAVIIKLQSSVYKEKFRGNQEMLNRLATCLSDIDELKDSYLISDWVETVKVFRSLDETAETIERSESKPESNENNNNTGGRFQSVSKPNDLPDNLNKKEDENVTEKDIRDGNQDPNIKLANQVKIKIIVSEVAHTQGKKNFRKFISPILSKLDYLPELGMFHSALMIGPWLIEWNNSALCIPRKCVSSAAMLSADVDALDTKLEVEELIQKLSKVIVKWNTTKLYHDTEKDKTIYGNCQDFVNDVLKAVGITQEFKGPLGRFLEKLRETGNEKLRFEMDQAFREKFKIKENKIEFTTHKQLDEFVNELIVKCPEFESDYRNEYAFLKSFDRAFWMKHFKFEKNEDWKPSYELVEDEDGEELEVNCPFKNPLETYSVRFIN